MRAAYLGLCKVVTRTRGEAKCHKGDCEEPIRVGEQYYQTIRGKPPKVWTRQFHLACVSSWLEYIAKYRAAGKEEKGRPSLNISPELRELRRSYNRRIRYIISKMPGARTAESCDELHKQLMDATKAIEEKTGAPWVQQDTKKRQLVISEFYSRRQRLHKDQLPVRHSTEEPQATTSPAGSLMDDPRMQDIMTRTARGYDHKDSEGGLEE